MIVRSLALAAGLALMASGDAAAQAAPSPYAGQQMRHIKSLSEQDIDDLRAGRGWGLAKAAELNGVPGPAHLLELADQIGLDAAQVAQISALKQDMSERAKPLGEKLVGLEAELDRQFAHGTITDERLRALLADIGATYAELRYAHLVTHLQTPPLLTAAQIDAYSRLRGYGPAAAPPAPEAGDMHDHNAMHGSH